MCFSPYLGIGRGGGGGGVPKGLVHHLLMQFFTLGSSNIEVSETFFFDTVIASNGHPRYAQHFLGSFLCFSPYLGIGRPQGGGGG